MDNRDYMKAYGAWSCSISPNSLVKSLAHDSKRSIFEHDYVLVTNLCNGFEKILTVSIKTIDGAKERYKEFNKALLEISPICEDEKKEVSAQIDLNAEEQKKRWIGILQAKGIIITE